MKSVIIGNATLHLCDCMDYMAGLPDKAFELAIVDLKRIDSPCNGINVPEVTFPKPNDFNAKFPHVCVLGYIERHAFNLPVVWSWVSILFAMPVITVKLYDNVFGRDESVNRKFPTNNMLANKIKASRFDYRITKLLKSVWFFPLVLIRAHLESVSLKALAFISAIYRTILLCAEYRGANKSGITNLTNQSDFVSSLMLVGAGNAARQSAGGIAGRCIKRLPASHAVFVNSGLIAPRLSMLVITRWGAKFNIFCAGFFNSNPAPNTQEFSNGVFHKPIVTQTQKPVKLYEWLLTNYAKPGQRILDTHLGSMSSVIAANNLGFELTGCELDPDFFKAGCERAMQATAQVRMFPCSITAPSSQTTKYARCALSI